VARVDMYRVMPGQMYQGERITLFALSDSFFDPDRYGPSWYREGDAASAAMALRAGEGVNVSVSLADRFGLRVGDVMKLSETPKETPFALPIVGVVWDYMSDRGTVVLNRRVLSEYWLDHNISRFNLVLTQDASPETVRQSVLAKLSDRYMLEVRLPRDLLAYHAAAIDRAFAFTDAIQLLVIIVTVAGIFDLLLAAVWERRRELALWRVIGADERSVRRSVVIESGTIGALGALLGVVVGIVSGWIWVGINFRYLLGYHLDYHFALGSTLWYVALAMTMTMLAGYGAARHATRQSVLDGIQTE
jgi:putative ABC transport system permease protein